MAAPLPSLFADDYRYVRDALRRLRELAPRDRAPEQIQLQFDDAMRTLSLQPNADLARLLDRELAPEMRPRDNQYALCADPALVAAAIDTARDGNDWPQVHYLWPLHPIAQCLDYKLLALFGRQRAPVARVGQGIAAGEAIVLVLAQVPYRRGQPLLTRRLGIRVDAAGQTHTVLTLEEVLDLTGLGSAPLANDGRLLDIAPIQAALPAVIQVAELHLKPIKQGLDADCKQRLNCELAKLQTQKGRRFEQLEFDFSTVLGQVNAARKRQKEAATADLFAQYQDWIRQTLELDDRAIVSNDANNRAASTVTVLPITSNLTRVYPFEMALSSADSGLPKDSKARAQQIHTIAKERITGMALGRLAADKLREVDAAIRLHLAL